MDSDGAKSDGFVSECTGYLRERGHHLEGHHVQKHSCHQHGGGWSRGIHWQAGISVYCGRGPVQLARRAALLLPTAKATKI